MLALGLPMVVLYEVALVVGWLNDRRKAPRGGWVPVRAGRRRTSRCDMVRAAPGQPNTSMRPSRGIRGIR
jgi:sec-independent protein translocase protein TatC